MPIYEYHCEDCRQDVEVLILSSGEEPVCPRCGGSNLTRLMSAFASAGGGDTAPGAGCAPGSGGFS